VSTILRMVVQMRIEIPTPFLDKAFLSPAEIEPCDLSLILRITHLPNFTFSSSADSSPKKIAGGHI